MGYKFVCRYLSGDPSGGKDITASEQSDLEAAGIDVVLNWETTGTDASNGYNAGVSDATAAKSEAESVGQPLNRPIYFSIDFDAQSGDAAAINEYFKGVASVIGVSRTGVYGGYYIVNELFNAGLVTWGWQTYAWSNGAWDSRAQLRQVQNGVDNGQLDADTGMVPDFGQYGPGSPVAADGGVAGYYAASYVSQSWPLASSTWSLTACQTVASTITLKNTGTLPWDSNTRIGTSNPRDRKSDFADSTWLSVNRAAAVTGTVPPGGTFEFKFDFHAPPTAGTYTEYFGVVQEGVAWFGDPSQGGPPDNDIEANIAVTGTGSCTIDPGVPDGAAGASNDGGSKHADSGVGSSGDDARGDSHERLRCGGGAGRRFGRRGCRLELQCRNWRRRRLQPDGDAVARPGRLGARRGRSRRRVAPAEAALLVAGRGRRPLCTIAQGPVQLSQAAAGGR